MTPTCETWCISKSEIIYEFMTGCKYQRALHLVLSSQKVQWWNFPPYISLIVRITLSVLIFVSLSTEEKSRLFARFCALDIHVQHRFLHLFPTETILGLFLSRTDLILHSVSYFKLIKKKEVAKKEIRWMGNVKHMCREPLSFCKCYAPIIVSGRQVIPLLCNKDHNVTFWAPYIAILLRRCVMFGSSGDCQV